MPYGNLINNAPRELRTILRALENKEKYIIRCKWSLTFNNVCIQENIMPTFSRIRHHDPAVTNTTPTIEYRKYLITHHNAL